MAFKTVCLTMTILLSICASLLISKITQPGECSKQAVFRRNKQKYLANHVIATKQAGSEIECGMYCVRDGSCASVNYRTSEIGKGRCELNKKTLQETPDVDGSVHDPDFNHLIVIKLVSKIMNLISDVEADATVVRPIV